ncbi:MAG: hypothetical protein ACRD3F_02095 [Acidobacteriaceae bacterium]
MRSENEVVAGYFAKAEDANQAIRELMDDGFGLSEIGAAFHSRASAPDAKTPRKNESGGDLPLSQEENQGLHLTGETSDGVASNPFSLWGGTPFTGASRPGPITGSEVPGYLPRDIPSQLDSNRESQASSHPYSSSSFENSFAGMGIPADHARRLARELQNGGAVVTVKAGSRAEAAERQMERNHGRIRYESAPLEMETGTESGGRVDVFGEVHRTYPGYMSGEDVRERKAS